MHRFKHVYFSMSNNDFTYGSLYLCQTLSYKGPVSGYRIILRPENSFEMEPSAYNPMIEYLCDNGKTVKAETFFRQLMKKGVLDSVAFNNLFRGHSKEGNPEFALEIATIMSRYDSKYFSTTKKGEIPELKEELNSQYKDKRKDAVKKVIAAMTVGKDVSSLFTDVVNCMQTENLELKKLVYLYLINYAKSQPDLAILAVNTFVKDSQDPNPLIRALAVRTMGCIRVDKITEYLCDPLQRCLKDDDPYVRKTAAICVAKLYDINAELVEDRGSLESLKDLISDNNPMVVANAVAALAEIQDSSSGPIFEITSHTLSKLLTALNACTEWGQVYIGCSI